MLQSYQGVVAAETAHIAAHESGAIEFGGHKVITLPQQDGKISAADLRALLVGFYGDEAYEHIVFPHYLLYPQDTKAQSAFEATIGTNHGDANPASPTRSEGIGGSGA